MPKTYRALFRGAAATNTITGGASNTAVNFHFSGVEISQGIRRY
jgi:hypothetical protein